MNARITPVVAIVALTVIEVVALFQGINGTVMSLIIGAIAGIGGYAVKGLKQP